MKETEKGIKSTKYVRHTQDIRKVLTLSSTDIKSILNILHAVSAMQEGMLFGNARIIWQCL
jgi:hypothetical protein